jgi:hypothetical protein
MTPEAQRMYNEMCSLEEEVSSNPSNLAKTANVVNRKMKDFNNVMNSIILTDDNLFDGVFCSSYADKYETETVAKFLDVEVKDIYLSKDLNETVRFTKQIMLYESLSTLFNVARYACDMSRKDFCIAWLLLNSDGSLGTILIAGEKHHSKLKGSIAAEMAALKSKGNEFPYMQKFLVKLDNPSGLEPDDGKETKH